MSEPVHALEALRIGWHSVAVKHQAADRLHAGVAARGRAVGVLGWRPAPPAALVLQHLEAAQQLAQLLEVDRALLQRWSVHADEQRDWECRGAIAYFQTYVCVQQLGRQVH